MFLFAATDREFSSTETVIAVTIWLTIVAALWLLPTIIAKRRRVANVGSIAVLNVLVGWLPVVWVICLALACQSAPPRAARHGARRRAVAGPWPPPASPLPPGWYCDPWRLRFHDGRQWTTDVAAAPASPVEPRGVSRR